MKKIISILSVVLLMAALASFAFAADETALTVQSVEAAAGETVTLEVALVNNPGGMTCFELTVSADEALELSALEVVGAEGWAIANNITNPEKGYILVASDAGTVMDGDAVLAKVTLKVKEDAAPASYAVNVRVDLLGDDVNDFIPAETVYTGYVTVPCTDHAWDEGVVTTEPTCETAGVKTFTCANCGATKTEEIAALGHAWDEGVVTTEPTCGVPGVKTFTCANCGATKTEEIAAPEHAWGEWVVVKEATTEAEGWEERTCANCGAVEGRAIPKEPVPPMGDSMIAVALATLSMAGIAVVVSKKKEF